MDTAVSTRAVIAHGDVRIEVWAQGQGPLIVLLPSLGRGAADFDPIAARLAAAGYRVLRPQPRGIGGSTGPLTGIDLHDCAADIAAVIAHEQHGPAFVVGHAFGNRVARMLATDRPELVRAVSLVAANVGKAPSPPNVREAIRNSANPSLPEEVRLEALRFAFFAPGNDAPRASVPGEIVPGNEFYDYDDKYRDGRAKLVIRCARLTGRCGWPLTIGGWRANQAPGGGSARGASGRRLACSRR